MVLSARVWDADDLLRKGNQSEIQMLARQRMAINYPHLIYIREDVNPVDASQWLADQGMRVKMQPNILPEANEVLHTTREHYRFVDAQAAAYFKLVWG